MHGFSFVLHMDLCSLTLLQILLIIQSLYPKNQNDDQRTHLGSFKLPAVELCPSPLQLITSCMPRNYVMLSKQKAVAIQHTKNVIKLSTLFYSCPDIPETYV